MPVLSTTTDASVSRLRSVRWDGLLGLAPQVVPAVARVLRGEPAEKALDQLLRAHREWSPEQRTAVVEALFGVGLWRRRLSWHAASAPGEEAPPSLLLACLLRDLAGRSEGDAAGLAGLPPGTLPPVRPPPEELGLRYSLPDWLTLVFKGELGPDSAPFFDALNQPGPVTARVNLLRTTRHELQRTLEGEGVGVTTGASSPLALHLHGRPNIYGLPSHRSGLFEIQDEGSQLLGLLLGAREGESVLDLCAGAGGKTLLLAAAVGLKGTVWAHDPDASRLERLRLRAERAGATNVRLLSALPQSLQADRVLVDAPCSSLGALRRGPDVRFRLDPSALSTFPPLQREILETGARHLRPGGRLVYATCTLRQEENEHIVHAFLDRHPGFVRRAPDQGLSPSLVHQGNFRCLPHLHGTDAFFGAVLEKTSG